MARAGFVARLLKPCAVAAFVAVVVACGGGGTSSGPEVVRITIAGMPGTALAPMQTAQLTASATYSDGVLKDISDTAAWDSTNRDVITVSPAGLVTATGPGNAEVSAVFASVRGAAAAEVVALPSAYLIDGLEYAFDYQLDALGRVVSYRISRRDGVSYPTAPTADPHPKECTGSLRGTYSCSATSATSNYCPEWSMTGEAGRLVTIPTNCTYFYDYTYVYGESGLVQFEKEWNTGSIHQTSRTTMTLAYDAAGRLSEVRTSCVSMYWIDGYSAEKTARITLDSLGRLLHEDVTTVVIPDWYPSPSVVCTADTLDWTYDPAGYMKTAGSTEYTADADGWLTSRRRMSGADTLVDTYAITRFGGRVVEEQFTQAEPSAFYTERSDSQRVRYEWSRLPTEPLFVPRALTGRNGADYLGIISSHNR